MKTNLLKYIFFVAFTVILVACSTKKNTFLSRNSHALSSKFNILYNGGLALEAGVNELKTTYSDNYWDRLTIERMQPSQEAMMPGEAKNPNFERAEEKAIKAIQKHSMNIEGGEKNPQMDEAHLVLGKARYYDRRFVPALEAFNYVLYKYPNSDKIYEVKVWREKANMRLENDGLAVNNLRKLLSEIKFKDQIYADANATLAQAFLNLEQKDSAVAKLKLATQYTKLDEEKARYRFILGQLFDELKLKDSSYAAYQSVIDMNRNAPRIYVIQAHAKQGLQFDSKTGDTIAFLEKYQKLLLDRENRPFLDVLNHQMALFYDKRNNDKEAVKYYNLSLRKNPTDQYLTASNYRNIADIYFNDAKYVKAGKYYDSTLVQLNPRTREHKTIFKKRENLNDVIKYEGIAHINDSIIDVYSMTEPQRTSYYEGYIAKLKIADELLRAREEKAKADAAGDMASGMAGPVSNNSLKTKMAKANALAGDGGAVTADNPTQNTVAPPGGNSTFYFYNPATVAYGKTSFRKLWGDRTFKNNWRLSASKSNSISNVSDQSPDDNADNSDSASGGKEVGVDQRYTVDFYTSKLPKTQKEIDSLGVERNFAYYQLGVIYKEKFKEYRRAADKLEQLLLNNPEERLVLPSMYNLFKIYEIIDPEKAVAMKNRIIGTHPDSRYAQILSNSSTESIANLSPDTAYNTLFRRYSNGEYKSVLANTELAIDQFTGDEIVSKFELLKAGTIGKLRGLAEYKKALNYVALTYPNSREGKDAEALLNTQIPALQGLKFSNSETDNWKILFTAKEPEEKNTKILVDKIKKFIADRQIAKITSSFDMYTEFDNFVVIHGLRSEEYAKGIASILKEFKDYKVKDVPIIISAQNYEVVQIKKNLQEYLNNPEFIEISVTDQIPFVAPAVIQAPDPKKVQVNSKILDSKAPAVKTPASKSTAPKTSGTGATPPVQQKRITPSQSSPASNSGQNMAPPGPAPKR